MTKLIRTTLLIAAMAGCAFGQVVVPGTGGTVVTTPAGTKTTVSPRTCQGTDKVTGIDAQGNITCAADTGGGGAHTLLGVTHSDTATATPVRGDIIIANTSPAWDRLVKGTADYCLRMNAAGTDPEWRVCPSGGAPSFTDITTGTNITAAMLVGSGGSLGFTGTGTLNAKSVNGTIFSNAESLGKIPIGQGDGTAVWADPLVQGLTAHDAPGSTTNPVAVGGYASTAAPTNVSADGDIVRAWHTLAGAYVSQLSHAGTLYDARAITSLPALPTGDNIIGRFKISDGTDVALVTAGGLLQVSCDAGCSGSSFADNSAFTFGTTPISNMGAVVDDTATNAVAENSAGAPRMTPQRGLHVNLRTAAGAEVTFGTEYADGDVDTTPNGTAAFWRDASDTMRAASMRKALPVQHGMATATLAAWTSATSVNSTQDIYTVSGTGAVLVHLVQTSTITAGAITFEVSYDGTNWVTIPADAVLDPASTTVAQISLPYTLQASTNKPFLLMGKGWQGLRIKLSTAITGTGSVTPNTALMAYEPAKTTIALSPAAANFQATVTQSGSNWSSNIAQINGVTPLMGNGVTGTGSHRVTISNDNSAIANWGLGATGSAVPSGAQYVAGRTGANLEGFERCDSQAFLNMSTATTTEIVALTSSQSIRVCSYRLMAGGTANVKFVRGTGTNCGTGTTDVSANFPLVAQSGLAPSGGSSPIYIITASNALCVTSSAAVTVAVEVSYTKY